MKTVALIMAGGTGARLYPRSTAKHPKQLIHLLGEGTMIQNTVMRLMPLFTPEDIYIVTSDDLAPLVKEQLPAIPAHNIVMEPFRRNTAPSLALSNIMLGKRYDPDTVVVAVPSDHIVHNVGEFHQSLEVAIETAHTLQGIVTIGIEPTRPETGYGYVQISDESDALGALYQQNVRNVTVFAEKPDVATAQRFIDAGDFLWNSGMFVYRLDTFDKEFQIHLPEHAPLFEPLKQETSLAAFNQLLHNAYRQIRPVSMDYGIMEKTNNVQCIISSFEWSDVGTWDELYRLSKKDSRKNVLEGDVFTVGTKGCFVSSYGKVIGLVGVEDLVVIDSENVLLITKRGNTQTVSELVDLLRRKQIHKLI
ncbi:MAG: mannose-1-phosphate guanylyltransferase [Candidatus Kapabacteria bacterium]|nr:mannose-1-phosphate guanylyltransferase [Candidatus Kapabacteria bacterium]